MGFVSVKIINARIKTQFRLVVRTQYEAEKERLFELKQKKRKQKHRGH
ncbi:DUF2992 family protein [Aminipila sp.]|nr:DUF2992 family protein [Aminipila sp.]